MATTIKIKSSVTPGKEPTSLAPAELAVNLKDQKLYTADTDGTVFELGASGDPGVTKLVAGSNITLTPAEGTGEVTIEAAGGGTGDVESVNGETGVVVLDAADVGAATTEQGAKADTAIQPGVVNPVYFANQTAFPDAASTDVHGGVAHSHADGAMFFAHNGTWNQLANEADLTGYVPLGSWAAIPALT